MRKLALTLSLIILVLYGYSQTSPFHLRLEEININNMPGIQSYVSGESESLWVLMGGRIDGLHDHRPPQSFSPTYANDSIYVVDPVNNQIWTAGITQLNTDIQNQLLATNINFTQIGDSLYLLGGYGVSVIDGLHHTHGVLTVIDVPLLIQAIQNGNSITSAFTSITDTRFKVTGGYLRHIGDTFYLVGGQDFDGRYNPMGGASYTQQYTSALQTFQLSFNIGIPVVLNYNSVVDTNHLHRRDYNVLNQIFPDQTHGLTAFSGVFQIHADLPYLDVVNIKPNGYAVQPNFEQKLNNYHCASVALYDSAANESHNLFFGGIAQFYFNSQDSLMEDQSVPFVSTIGRVTRFANDSMAEYKMATTMPALLGSGAEFIHEPNVPQLDYGIIDLASIPYTETLIGYVVGGIESPQANVFMTGVASYASNRVFKVYLTKDPLSSTQDIAVNANHWVKIYPNPTIESVTVDFRLKESGMVQFTLINNEGKTVKQLKAGNYTSGQHQVKLDLPDSVQPALYFIEIKANGKEERLKLIVGE